MDALEKRVGSLPDHVHEYDRSLRAIRSTDYKLIRGSDGIREVYHAAEDPDEGTISPTNTRRWLANSNPNSMRGSIHSTTLLLGNPS